MLGCKERGQFELFVTGSLRQRVSMITSWSGSIAIWTSRGCAARSPTFTVRTTGGLGLIRRWPAASRRISNHTTEPCCASNLGVSSANVRCAPNVRRSPCSR